MTVRRAVTKIEVIWGGVGVLLWFTRLRMGVVALCLSAGMGDQSVPDPILVSIAAALAGKAADSLYDLVKQKFGKRSSGSAALQAAEGAAPDSAEVVLLAAELGRAEQCDPDFSARLRDTWHHLSVRQHTDLGVVTNQISGDVAGKVVQARDIGGSVDF